MKKVLSVLFVTALFAGGIFMSSCNKCATCNYTYTLPDGSTTTVALGEVCGNNNDVDDFKELCESEAGLVNANCECVDE